MFALSCAAIFYFYPFLSSSIHWMGNSHLRYENRAEVKLPFRWVSGEGAGLTLEKPAAAIKFTPDLNTSLNISDHGPDFKPSDQGRKRAFQGFGIVDSIGTPFEPTYPFTSFGLLCSRIDKIAAKPSEYWSIVCFSSDSRYFLQYTGKEKGIREASEIAKQVIR